MNSIEKKKLISKFDSLQKWNKKLFKKEIEKCDLDYNYEIEALEQTMRDTKRLYNKIK